MQKCLESSPDRLAVYAANQTFVVTKVCVPCTTLDGCGTGTLKKQGRKDGVSATVTLSRTGGFELSKRDVHSVGGRTFGALQRMSVSRQSRARNYVGAIHQSLTDPKTRTGMFPKSDFAMDITLTKSQKFGSVRSELPIRQNSKTMVCANSTASQSKTTTGCWRSKKASARSARVRQPRLGGSSLTTAMIASGFGGSCAATATARLAGSGTRPMLFWPLRPTWNGINNNRSSAGERRQDG